MTIIRPPRDGELATLGDVQRTADTVFAGTSHAEFLDGLGIDAETAVRYLALGRLLVAQADDGSIVGFINWWIEHAGTELTVDQVSVVPAAARQGVGTLLLRTVVAIADDAGQSVVLNTQSDVPWNEPWYRREGFVVVDRPEWTSWMLEVVDQQTADGLDWSTRVWMRKSLLRSGTTEPQRIVATSGGLV